MPWHERLCLSLPFPRDSSRGRMPLRFLTPQTAAHFPGGLFFSLSKFEKGLFDRFLKFHGLPCHVWCVSGVDVVKIFRVFQITVHSCCRCRRLCCSPAAPAASAFYPSIHFLGVSSFASLASCLVSLKSCLDLGRRLLHVWIVQVDVNL